MIADRVQTIVDRIVTLTHPSRVILFGSSARGDAGTDSDIDLLVIVEPGTHRRHTAQNLYKDLASFGFPVDIVVATRDDIEQFRDEPGYIYSTALREGQTVYAA